MSPMLYTSIILLTKITAAQNEGALSYHRVRGLYFMAVVFAATIYNDTLKTSYHIRVKFNP